MPFMTSPNGSSAWSGQYAAHSSYRTRPISIASVVAKPAPTASPISSSKYGKCHWSGASTTPSSEMKKCDLILRTRGTPWLDLQERVHLADRLREHLERAHAL